MPGRRALSALILIAGGGGCMPPVAEPTEFSPEIASLRALHSPFPGSDDPLEGAVTGDVIDVAGALEGCWGLHRTGGDDGITVAYTFDSASGDFAAHVFIDGPPVSRVVIQRGSYEVIDSDRILVTLDTLSANDPQTGLLTTAAVTLDPFEQVMTLGGARLEVHYSNDSLPQIENRTLVLGPFPCP